MPRYTRSFLFPDVNVWIALTYERHAHHVAARNWFAALERDARLFFCRFTPIGFLRLLTNEAVMGPDGVMGQAEAWEVYDRWAEDGRVLYVDEPRGLEPSFRSVRRAASRLPGWLACAVSLIALVLASAATLAVPTNHGSEKVLGAMKGQRSGQDESKERWVFARSQRQRDPDLPKGRPEGLGTGSRSLPAVTY
jgi:hypothetical protein